MKVSSRNLSLIGTIILEHNKDFSIILVLLLLQYLHFRLLDLGKFSMATEVAAGGSLGCKRPSGVRDLAQEAETSIGKTNFLPKWFL